MSLCDGSVISSADVPVAIDECRKIVERDEDIILDLIMVQEGNFKSHFHSKVIREGL